MHLIVLYIWFIRNLPNLICLIRCYHLEAPFVRHFHRCRDSQASWESPEIYMPDAEKELDGICRSQGSAGIPHPLTNFPIGYNSNSHCQAQSSISKNPSFICVQSIFLLINY